MDAESSSRNNNENRQSYHRLSDQQFQTLEEFFKEYSYPDDFQQLQLAKELKLNPDQINFWFQYKRAQLEAENKQGDNTYLREENKKLKSNIKAILKALRRPICPSCGALRSVQEERTIRNLRSDNVFLKRENENLIRGNLQGHILYGSSSSNHPVALEPPSLRIGPSTQPPQPRTLLQLQHFQPLSQVDKNLMSEMAAKAVAEVIELINIEKPIWTKSAIDGRLIIDEEKYKIFFKEISSLKISNPRFESSKDVVVVPMDARNLIDVFSDTEKWERLFSTIVTKANTIHELESMDQESKSITKLIYEEMHILSPLVPPREFIILRRCQQINEDLWVVADVSCHIQNVDFDSTSLTCAKYPSGCLIQKSHAGSSMVTWMEHVKIDDKVHIHELYKDLICSGSGYGARRWTITLERMQVRLSMSTSPFFFNNDRSGVVKTIEGRMNIMELGERMLKNFASLLKMSENFEFLQLYTNNSGVRVSMRTDTEAGQPPCLIVSSSFSIPIPPRHIYNLLTNYEIRHQWDNIWQENPFTEVARFVTGEDNQNCVTLLQPSSAPTKNEMVLLQESFIDALGGIVVYSTLDLKRANALVLDIVDLSSIPIQPSGFTISQERHTSAPNLDGSQEYGTTILTLASQFYCPSDSRDSNMQEFVNTMNNYNNSTIQKIKAMLNCCDSGPDQNP